MKKITRITAILLLMASLTMCFISCGKDKNKVEDGEPYENGEEIDGSDDEHTKLY